MNLGKTSNPAFTDYFWDGETTSNKKMSVHGILIKTFACLAIIALITVLIWYYYSNGNTIKWFVTGGMLGAIIISIVISVRKDWAPVLVPIYAVVKGCFIGGITSFAKAKFPDLPYQAIGVTVIAFFVMLTLYQTRLIVVTKKLRSIIIVACSTIFLTYIISWILSFFGIRSFLWGTSWIAIVFNILAAIFASLSLLLDFDYIERRKNKAPKSKEWLATWGLLVTIVWLYVEILRLMRKFSIKF
ncbi:Bax inhibitor-1/YccA family protein [Hanstruepera marina]|uniref:Bax inhibitor-1/YccA family protein n=1 Tax=Hanstruepera marina TaxID=2873265 RepID=UPI001CA6EB56|nr:Bax inhibitor-1/YccA family protein [Hanstruepera marina]